MRNQRVAHRTRHRICLGVNGLSRVRIISLELHEPSLLIIQRHTRAHAKAESFLLRLFLCRSWVSLSQSLKCGKVGGNWNRQSLRVNTGFGKDICMLILLYLINLCAELFFLFQNFFVTCVSNFGLVWLVDLSGLIKLHLADNSLERAKIYQPFPRPKNRSFAFLS